MKTMKLWRNILVMTAAFSLASCSSGDDTDIYVATELTAPLIYSPPTGQQATPQFIASTPLPMLDICIFRPSPLTPQLHSPWIATSAVSPARR